MYVYSVSFICLLFPFPIDATLTSIDLPPARRHSRRVQSMPIPNMLQDFVPRQLSTYALTLFRYDTTTDDGKKISVDFWDTAGQERFNKMHPSYYFQANACILVFDVTRKESYQHLQNWYQELRNYCPQVPVICVANKIDVNMKVTTKKFKFPRKHKLPFFFVSAAGK